MAIFNSYFDITRGYQYSMHWRFFMTSFVGHPTARLTFACAGTVQVWDVVQSEFCTL